MLYIDPAVCIDCSACVPKCPVNAIFDEFDLPDDKREWIGINANEAPSRPVITEKQAPLPGAEKRKAELGL
jgi:ferredoxin